MGILVERKTNLPANKSQHYRQMDALEQGMLSIGGFEAGSEEAKSRTRHHHCNGAYVREYRMAKGEVVTGKIHRYACINILLKGRIMVVQSDGKREIEQGEIYISEPGEKKALYALEDTVFLNVHATELTDEKELEEYFTMEPEEALLLEDQSK